MERMGLNHIHDIEIPLSTAFNLEGWNVNIDNPEEGREKKAHSEIIVDGYALGSVTDDIE